MYVLFTQLNKHPKGVLYKVFEIYAIVKHVYFAKEIKTSGWKILYPMISFYCNDDNGASWNGLPVIYIFVIFFTFQVIIIYSVWTLYRVPVL